MSKWKRPLILFMMTLWSSSFAAVGQEASAVRPISWRDAVLIILITGIVVGGFVLFEYIRVRKVE